jgi:hypothetical protein
VTAPERVAIDEYLRCGLLEQGFVLFHCDACGEDRFVAFSCKNRGPHPSRGDRRMTNRATHLADRVFPDVPVRQWVLSLPFALRVLVARQPAALLAASRPFVEKIVSLRARQAREKGGVAGKSGAVTFVQRFGGSLDLHVHFHVVADGVFAERGAGDAFVPLRAPPPWQPLARFHGVFAPNHAWRSLVVLAPVATPERPARCLRPPQPSLFPRPPSALRASDDPLP